MNVAVIEHQGGSTAAGGPPDEQSGRAGRVGWERWMILPAQLLLLFIVVFPLLMQIYISLTYLGADRWR